MPTRASETALMPPRSTETSKAAPSKARSGTATMSASSAMVPTEDPFQPEALADAKAIAVPLLLFFGGKDDYITPETVARIDRTLSELGKEHEVVSYPNVGHAFFRESSAAADQHEVSDAWKRVQAFLRSHLA